MAINPIQLPVWKDVPQIDFKGLDALGDSYGAYRQRGALADNLPAMLGVEQPQQGNSLATLGQPQPQGAAPSVPGGTITPTQTALLTAAAQKYGLDPNYLLTAAKIEGTTKNPASSAQGLGQFIDSTAKQYGVVRGDDASAADAFARFTVDNKAALTKALGRDPTPGELYLAHQQGAGGAIKLLTNPNAQAASLVGQGAVVNNGGSPLQTGGDFANRWTRLFGNGQPRPVQVASADGGVPSALAFNGTPAQDQANLAPGVNPQSASVSSQPGGASVQPSQVAPAAQPQPQQIAQASPQAAPGAPVSSPIPPDTMARLQAMIRAGGPAQTFAMAILQKYVVPQTPVVVNEGGIAFNPVTGAVIARGQSKSYPVAAGGALVTPGAPGAQGGAGAAPVYTNENGKLDPQTLDGMARRYLETGDNQIITDAGNGTMGAVNRAALMNRVEQLRAQTGKSGADIVGAKGDSGNQVKSIENFGTGPQGNTVRSLNVAVDHLALLRNLAREMASSGGRSDFRPTNALVNEWNKVFGSDLPTNVEAAKHIVAAEITKAITGSQGALGDREELAAPLATANSWEQLSGVIDKAYTPLMAGQLKGLRQQYVTSTKKSEGDFNNMLSERTRSALEGKGIQGEQQSPKLGDVNIPIPAAKALQANPSLRQQFDAKYGAGASDRVLGPQR